jgi:hypothetical protein
MRKQGRIFISGTGRAGTTFLIRLLTKMGEDTGFEGDLLEHPSYFPSANAGLELDIFKKDNPRIVKSPFLCDQVDTVLSTGMRIDHVIIPVRSFHEAAASRERIQIEGDLRNAEDVPGGLWDVTPGMTQEEVLRKKFSTLVEALVRNEIPMTFMSFPRLACDPEYLFVKLKREAFPHLEKRIFDAAFSELCDPGLIHEFSAGS